MSKRSDQEKQAYIEKLREWLKPGDTVYTVLRSVSSSGMSRKIDLYTFKCEDGKVHKLYLSGYAAVILGWRRDDKSGAIRVGGCGMDMGFHTVYTLSRILYPEGFKVDGYGRNGDTSGWDNDGGYALNHEWV